MTKEKLLKLTKDYKKGFTIKRPNIDEIVDYKYIKNLRKEFDFTQAVFASVLGVSVKTVEKWEQRKINPRLSTKNLIYLLGEHPEIMKSIYDSELVKDFDRTRKYIVKIIKEKTSDVKDEYEKYNIRTKDYKHQTFLPVN